MDEKIMQVLMVIVVAGGISAIIMLVQKRKNRTAWAGTVVSISRHAAQDAEDLLGDRVLIVCRLDDGQPFTYEVDASSYGFWFSGLAPGDRLVKPAGEQIPKRVAAAQQT